MNRKKRWILAVILILAVLAAYVLVSLWVSTNYIVVREYTADTGKSETGFRAAVFSDLHDHRFGGDNEKLAEEIRQREQTIGYLGLVGTVTPVVKQSVAVKRYSTLYPLEKSQTEILEPAFNKIIGELDLKK